MEDRTDGTEMAGWRAKCCTWVNETSASSEGRTRCLLARTKIFLLLQCAAAGRRANDCWEAVLGLVAGGSARAARNDVEAGV